MGGKDWEQNSSLTHQLFSQSRDFSFIQAYRLINLFLKQELGDSYLCDDAIQQIKIRPELSLEFPRSDISQINLLNYDDKLRCQITATFLGLYGSSSPLPSFYTEDLFRDQVEDNQLTREFIDIFNNHLYQLFFKIWDSHQLSYQVLEAKNPSYLAYLYRFGGVEDIETQRFIPTQYNFLRYLGILGHLPRSALGLKTILADLIEISAVEILQCVDSVLDIPFEQRLCLGVNGNLLGDNSHVGSQIISASHAFTVRIGPVTQFEFRSLLPESEKFQTINQVVSSYIDQPLTYNIELVVCGEQLSSVVLGDKSCSCLGHNTWLFANGTEKELNYILNFKS